MATRIQLVLQIDYRETWAARVNLQAFSAVYIDYRRNTVMVNYTYLLECADGTLYCGWTSCLKKRLHLHNEGRGAKYTKSRRPVRLVYYEEFETKQEAMRREAAIKKLSRRDKLILIAAFRPESIMQQTNTS